MKCQVAFFYKMHLPYKIYSRIWELKYSHLFCKKRFYGTDDNKNSFRWAQMNPSWCPALPSSYSKSINLLELFALLLFFFCLFQHGRMLFFIIITGSKFKCSQKQLEKNYLTMQMTSETDDATFLWNIFVMEFDCIALHKISVWFLFHLLTKYKTCMNL